MLEEVARKRAEATRILEEEQRRRLEAGPRPATHRPPRAPSA
jgi:hypothetical protein